MSHKRNFRHFSQGSQKFSRYKKHNIAPNYGAEVLPIDQKFFQPLEVDGFAMALTYKQTDGHRNSMTESA